MTELSYYGDSFYINYYRSARPIQRMKTEYVMINVSHAFHLRRWHLPKTALKRVLLPTTG